MFTCRLPRIEVLLVVLAGICHGGETRSAPRPEAAPVNQLSISGNACGPAALLASFRCGSDAWQRASAAFPGKGDREQIGLWIRRHGLQPSATLKGRRRWTSAGINVEDLVAAANECTRPLFLPQVAQDELFLRRGEDGSKLLRRGHRRLESSLKKGIPPLLSLRRFVLRGGRWTAVQGHFVTVIAVPARLPRRQTEFAFTYLDPWGGKRSEGIIRVAQPTLLDGTCLEASVPAANIGKKEIRKGESTAVVPAAVIGRW
jgi:hypothetical protein